MTKSKHPTITRVAREMALGESAVGIIMSREEAEDYMRALDKGRMRLTGLIKTVRCKRLWSDAQKAMQCGEYLTEQTNLMRLQERIGTAFNLGGY